MAEKETIKGAYVKAWLEVKNPNLDATNPHYKSRYSTLKETLEVIKAACKKHNIAYRQTIKTTLDGKTFIASDVVDSDGDKFSLSSIPIEVDPNPQKFGSTLTYIKRQQAQADWGITGDDDDDGEGANGRKEASPLDVAKSELWQACLEYCQAGNGNPREQYETYMNAVIAYMKDLTNSLKNPEGTQ